MFRTCKIEIYIIAMTAVQNIIQHLKIHQNRAGFYHMVSYIVDVHLTCNVSSKYAAVQ